MQQQLLNKSGFLASMLLIGALFICIWSYSPGLNGGFYLDDAPNIEDNSFLHINTLAFSEIWQAAWSGQAGHLKRPIPMLSFALNMYFAENDVKAMKITNLTIHILSAILIVYLLYLLISISNIKQSKQLKAKVFASAVGVIWLLHPFNLTSVLYVVQRMTSLSALFMLVAIISYTFYRKKQLTSQGHWIKLIITTGFFGVLALFSKENAILLPLYFLSIEFFIFKFKAYSKRDTSTIKLLLGITIILPIAMAIVFILMNPNWISNWYAHRPFTLEQRLLTEARVVVWYARMIIAPDIFNMGLLLDDFELSTSMWNPITTILSFSTIILSLLFTFTYRNKLPLISFGIAWFLSGHLLESTILPLEIAFEHRNYLPSIGLLLAFSNSMYLISQKIRYSRLFLATIFFIWVALLSFTTHARAEHWKSPANLALIDVEYHPNSTRANIYAGAVFVNLAMSAEKEDKKSEYISKADYYFLNASKLDKVGASSAVGRIIVQSIFGLKPDDDFIAWTIDMLATRKLDASSQHALTVLTNCQISGFCNIPQDTYLLLINTMIDNKKVPKKYRSSLLIFKALYYSDILNDYEEAKNILNDAINIMPDALHYRFDLVKLEVLMKNYEQAKVELDFIKKNDKLNFYKKNTDDWEKLIAENI